jgi:alpha-tubulin suppressor-like RCC1 family protein
MSTARRARHVRRTLIASVLTVVLIGLGGVDVTAAQPGPSPAPEGSLGPVLTGVAQVANGRFHTCARLSSGQARCWGLGGDGQLGNADDGDSNQAVLVRNVAGSGPLTGVRQIGAGNYHSCALLTNHQVRCWGLGGSGELGNGETDDHDLPVAVRNASGTANLTNVRQLSVGGNHACALLTDRTVRCWGYNDLGQLGDDSRDDRPLPVRVLNPAGSGPLTGVASIAAGGLGTCAVLTNGQARCWGRGLEGQLGDGETEARRLRPVVVQNRVESGPLRGVAGIDIGPYFTCARMENRQVRCWGDGDYGGLGNGHTDDHPLPVVVRNVPNTGPLTTVTQVSVGDLTACARLANGQVRCWGYGPFGQLGNGDVTETNPLPLATTNPADTAPLAGVTQLSTTSNTSCARLTNGEARCWGAGDFGQVGNGTNNAIQSRTARVRVSTLS